MKLQGMAGKGSGKLGSQVYAISGGEQIVRQYNPTVTNPSTEGQVETRSKFKLLSQLGAALSGVIAIKREGLVSGRNQFMKINKENTMYTDLNASINLNRVQITKSNRGIANFNADRTGGASISVSFGERVDANIDKAVYAGFIKDADGSLTQLGSVVVNIAGASGDFPADLPWTDKSVVIYAYGIKVTSERASAAFGNMICPSAEQVARLMTTSSDVATGTVVTKTKGLTMLEGTDTGSSEDDSDYMVSVSSSGNGRATGGGRFNAGQSCTVVATPVGGSTFEGWYRDTASGERVSTQEEFTFIVRNDVALVAVFEGGETPSYNVNVTTVPSEAGSISGGGNYPMGSQCTLRATANEGFTFLYFTDGINVLSTNPNYTFTVDRNITVNAVYDGQNVNPFHYLKLNGTRIDSNITRNLAEGIGEVTGQLSVARGSTNVCLVKSESKPTIGQEFEQTFGSSTNMLPFSVSTEGLQLTAGKYWIVGAHIFEALGTTVVDVVANPSIELTA